MSTNGLQFKGRPNSNRDDSPESTLYYTIYRYCGGAGAVDCREPLGITGIVLEYKVSKLIVYNRLIVFQNSVSFGVNIVTDAGPAGLCTSSAGTSVDFYMGLSASGTDDIETTAKAGTVLNDPIGDFIEFDIDMLPQPTDSDWQAKIFVYLWWGDATYLNTGGGTAGAIDERAFKIVKHDNDIRI